MHSRKEVYNTVICASINSFQNLHNQHSPLKKELLKKKKIHIIHSIIDLLHDTTLLFFPRNERDRCFRIVGALLY